MPRSRLYQVRVPALVRHLFGNADRLRQRFSEPDLGRSWANKLKSEISDALVQAKHGVEARTARVDLAPEITLAEAAELWIEDRPLEPSTRRMYREHLKPHVIKPMGSLNVSTIDRARLSQHLAARLRTATATSAGKDVLFVQAIIRWAAEMGWRTDASALLVKRPKAVPKITRRWDPAVLAHAIERLDPRDRVVAEVALGTGMRSSELRAFDCSWIRWSLRVIVVPVDETHRTKSKKPRTLPLHARLRSILRVWLTGRTAGPVFPPLRSKGNAPSRGRDMRRIARKLRDLAGDAVATGLHDLRHAYLSGLAAKGLPVDELRDLAGHSSIVVTERYMHAAPGRIDRARRLLDTRVDARRRRAGAKR